MGAKQSTKSMSKEDKLATKYLSRLREIKSSDISGISLEGLERLCHQLDLELNKLDSKNASKLSVETRASIKDQYTIQRQQYCTILKECTHLTIY